MQQGGPQGHNNFGNYSQQSQLQGAFGMPQQGSNLFGDCSSQHGSLLLFMVAKRFSQYTAVGVMASVNRVKGIASVRLVAATYMVLGWFGLERS